MKTTNAAAHSKPVRIDLGFAKECDRKNRNPIRRALRNWRTFAPWCLRVGAFAVVVLVVLLFVDIDLRLRELTKPINAKSGNAESRPPEWYLSRILSRLSSIDSDISSVKIDAEAIRHRAVSIDSDLDSILRGLSTIEVRINR